jgi:hypothetical protein
MLFKYSNLNAFQGNSAIQVKSAQGQEGGPAPARFCTKSRKFMGACKNRVTLKALANISPGFALKPWVQKYPGRLFATLTGLRGSAVNKRRRNSFRVAPSRNGMRFPRVAKAQPWAGIGERFQRYSFPIGILKSGYRFDFLWKAPR